jgi:hypothetical protein
VTVGDFTGTGRLDLALANEGAPAALSVLLNNGDGTFQAPVSYAYGLDARSVIVTDVNDDGIPDLALASYNLGRVSVLLGNGDGTFAGPDTFAAGLYASSIVAGDFDGNGYPDLAVANANHTGTVSVLLNGADWSGGAPALSTHRRADALSHLHHGRTMSIACSVKADGNNLLIGDEEGGEWRYAPGKEASGNPPVQVDWTWAPVGNPPFLVLGTDGKPILRQDQIGLPKKIIVGVVRNPSPPAGAPLLGGFLGAGRYEFDQVSP